MTYTEINDGAMKVMLPEGFKILSDDDIRAMGRTPKERDWAVRDTERHLIMEIAWEKVPFLAGFADIEQVAENTARRFKKMTSTYRKLNTYTKEIGGEKAGAVQYGYTVSGVDVTAEYLIVKHAGMFYSFSWLARKETAEENYKLLDAILASVAFR